MAQSNIQIMLNGGAFLVHDSKKGGENNEIGWAYITIHSLQTIEVGHIENTVARSDKTRIPLKFIKLKQQLRPDQLEFVTIMCNRAFNTIYAYNFSQKSVYLAHAENFFNGLS